MKKKLNLKNLTVRNYSLQMQRIILITLFASAFSQTYKQGGPPKKYQPPQHYEKETYYYSTRPPPQIISHKQAQNHNGAFKFAFTAENGLTHGEEISPDGSRTGGYSYIDPHGKKITVKYSAGKEGFRIIEGDHLPRPVPLPAHHPQPAESHHQYKPPSPQKPPQQKYIPQKYIPQSQPKKFYTRPPPPIPPPILRPQEDTQTQYYVRPEKVNYYDGEYERPVKYSNVPIKSEGYKGGAVIKSYIPPAKYAQEPRKYETATASNSLEEKEPDYDDEPGKPYSFGKGYFFHFEG